MSNTGYRRCCGMDVHKKVVTVHVLPPDGAAGEDKSREFRTFRRDLDRMRQWLGQCKVTAVVMESTGQYWRPVWEALEGWMEELVLMNPQHVRGLKGRKTDRADAKWLARHLSRGELKGSFVAPRAVRELRELTRTRVHVLEDINRVKNRITQVCETGNVKISSVASDLFGVTGRRMLNGLVEGQRDAAWMADWAKGRLRSKRGELRMALEHRMSEHQRWLLKMLLEQLGALEREVAELTAEIERRVADRQELIERLMSIPGVDRIVAWTVLAETGFDMTVFEDSRHLASWAGLCPGNHESGGKRRSGRMRKGNLYLRRVLNQAAWGASHKKNSYFESLYRRYRARMGHAKAIMALAHRLLAVIYHVAAGQGSYRELGGDFCDRRQRRKVTRQMVERLERLGYKVTLEEPVPEPGDQEAATGVPPMPKKRGRPCKCAERGIPCPHAAKWAAKYPPPTDPAQTQIVDFAPDQIVGFS